MATTDLYRALSRRLFRMVLPTRVFEHRDYRGRTLASTLAGMAVRLDEDRTVALEENFPISDEINFAGAGTAKVTIALFKKETETSRWLKGREAIIFTLNGQAHAFLPRDFFNRATVGLKWISQDLLVEVDCSRFSAATIEQIFMPSRDRMRESDEQGEVETQLAFFLHTNAGLREWNERRHSDAVRSTVESDEHTRDLLQELVSANRDVAALMFPGISLPDPGRRGEVSSFRGKRFPSFLKLRNGKARPHIKKCPRNSYCRVEFETDVENDYFVRASEPGEFTVSKPDLVLGKSLWNGCLR
jgi:hypothetical protein